jgi:hypothetical protein
VTRRRDAWLDARNQKRLRRVKVSTSRVRWTSCMYVCMCQRWIFDVCSDAGGGQPLHAAPGPMVHGGRGRGPRASGPRTKPSETKFALPLSRFYSDRSQTLCVGVWYIYVSGHVLSEPKTAYRSGTVRRPRAKERLRGSSGGCSPHSPRRGGGPWRRNFSPSSVVFPPRPPSSRRSPTPHLPTPARRRNQYAPSDTSS